MKRTGLLNYKRYLAVVILFASLHAAAQDKISKVWVADNGNGTYRNPVIHADYSDPDVIRTGDDYYMISSSFSDVPGLPILHSKDLVNWRIIGHVLPKLLPNDHFSKPQHGNGVWAPSIRFHKGEFYIYYPDPDFGIYLVKAKNILGTWSEPMMVEAGKGLIDPCPLWDDDGKAYLVHALAGSRAGIKSVIIVKPMNAEGTKTTAPGVMVYDGHRSDPTIEGPKFYKRNGYYYIFAPAGGVSTGWQTVLRSKHVYGPYERKVVMDQGATPVNGPHQGAWVTTPTGEDWFLHFQDKEAYGRIVHLQPVKWVNDWPVIGADKDGDGKGEPVLEYKKPSVGKAHPVVTPAESDEFNGDMPGLQWQWACQPAAVLGIFNRYEPAVVCRAGTRQRPEPVGCTESFPAKISGRRIFRYDKMVFNPKTEGERSGLLVMGLDYAYISLVKKADGIYLSFATCKQSDKGKPETEQVIQKMPGEVFLRLAVRKGAACEFSFSSDGSSFTPVGEKFMATPGKWIGAKMGFFCTGTVKTNDAGGVDIDWFRIDKIAR